MVDLDFKGLVTSQSGSSNQIHQVGVEAEKEIYLKPPPVR